MLISMVFIFIIGYLCIALEHTLKVNKSAPALLTGTLLWVIYMFGATEFVPTVSAHEFNAFLANNPRLADLPLAQQCINFVTNHQILDSIGEISETLIFLIGAMLTVELIDAHGGFNFITNRITTRKKRKLLWLIATLTFFMSAVLDNLTTSIVMVMLISKLIENKQERWLFGGIIIIAANSGGAWSPIGDVTTIMLWIRGNISTGATIPNLFIPCLISAIIPVLLIQRKLTGTFEVSNERAACHIDDPIRKMKRKKRITILVMGLSSLLFVPIFKTVTHLPPFIGMLFGISLMWIYTELSNKREFNLSDKQKPTVAKIIHHIDGATLLFFLGILLAVDTLKYSGVLNSFSAMLDTYVGNVYAVNIIIGLLSSIIDNVPLVAAAIGMYPIADQAMVAASANPEYMSNFMQDGTFWQFLTYCAGVGGSSLIIGSAAGVIVMGLEKISFMWYIKNISLLAVAGYLAGAAWYIVQNTLIHG